MDKEKVFSMKLQKVYPLLVQKAGRKGRTQQEVDQVICWLTGYDAAALQRQLERDMDYGAFFREAPLADERSGLVSGVVCGVRVEEVEDPLLRQIRCLDKLVDELSRGRDMDKILNRERRPHGGGNGKERQ